MADELIHSIYPLPPALPSCSRCPEPRLSESRDLESNRRTMERFATRGEEALEVPS